jgi:hypothetical protein
LRGRGQAEFVVLHPTIPLAAGSNGVDFLKNTGNLHNGLDGQSLSYVEAIKI